MPRWHDILSFPPPPGEQLLFRRYPEDTPPFWGVIDPDTSVVLCGPDGWQLPWQFVTHWANPTGPVPAWPGPALPTRSWRDPYVHPCEDGSCGWLRRFDNDCATALATFDAGAQTFTINNLGWVIPWYCVWKWKPA